MQKLEMNLSQEILEHSRNFAPPNESIVPGFIKRFYGDEQEELVAPIQPTWFAVFDSFLYVYSRGPSELDVQAAQDVIWILDSTLKKISSGQAQEPELAKLFEDGWCPVEVMNSRIQTKVWIFVKQKEFNDFYARLKLGCTRKDDIQLKLTKKTHKAEYYEKLFLKEVNQDNGRVKFSNSVDSAITISEDMFTNGDFFQHPDSSAESKEFSLESASREPKLSKNLVNLDLEDNSNVYRESSFSSDSECESVGRDTLLSKEEKFIKTENTEVEVIRRLAKSFADGFDDTLFSSGVIEESNHDRRQRLEDDSGKNEDIAIAKIWACTWNMGVKDIFKLPSDSTAAEADYFKKIHLENFKKCIPSGFQLYVFAVQECISERFFELLSEYLEPMGCQRVVLDPEKDRVWGRGDGSFINPKFTGIAIYMHYDLLPKFSLLRIGARNLSMFEGSKGGTAVSVRIGSTTIAFISSHLPAKNVEDRRRAYRILTKVLGNELGNPHFELRSQFHHIVFMGDLNYRTTNISLEDTMQLMKIKDLDSLRQYDEFLWDVSNQLAFLGFWEPPFSKDFYPTYKKKEKRPSEVDKSNSKWIDLVYRTQYKEPWYKSGKVQPRMPSYCDRILIHSIREAPTYLLPAVDGDILSQYRAIEDQLTGSDHSAVSCGFVLTIPYRNRIRWRNDWRKQPKILKVTIGNVSIVKNSTTSNPKSVRALFPMPYEAGNDFPVSEFFSKESFQAEKKPSLSWISPPHTHTLHLSLKIRTESDIHGECVIPLSLLEFKEGKTLQFTETLYQYGIPLCDSNEKVFANIELALSQSIATIPGAWEFLKEEKQAQNQSSPTSQLSSPKTFRSRFNRSRYMS